MYFECFAFFVILFILAWRSHASTRYRRQLTDNLPGPFNVPVLGCIAEAFSLTPRKLIKKSYEMNARYGNLMKVWAFNYLFIFSSNTEFNQQLLSSSTQLTKANLYSLLNQWLGVGLLISDGRKWHARRKIITPTFHFSILEQFLEVFERQSTVLVQCLAERADGKTAFNILPYICPAALDIIAETAMGVKVNAQTDRNMPYTKAVNEMTDLMMWRFVRVHLKYDNIFSIMHPFKKWRQTKLIQTMHRFTTKVIEDRRQALENKLHSVDPKLQNDPDDVGSRKHMALMDVLLQSSVEGKPLTNEDIREEVDTFMFEGHDTTTAALSFILHTLARYPQIQRKVLDEIYQVYGEKTLKPFTLMNLNELKYLECVIKETLRLYPPVPFLGREITEEFKYTHSRLGDGIVPAGTQVVIPIFNTQRDPEIFERPTEFIPERHETTSAGSAYSFIPFSAGPRNCIGQKFAMFEMKVVLVKILREYELLPMGPEVEPILGIVMRSETGMQLGLRKRSAL